MNPTQPPAAAALHLAPHQPQECADSQDTAAGRVASDRPQPLPASAAGTGAIRVRLSRPEKLDRRRADGLWNLYSRHHPQTSRASYEVNLAQAHLVLLLSSRPDGSLLGYLTLTSTRRQVQGRSFLELFADGPIGAPSHWELPGLRLALLAWAAALRLRAPRLPVYWYLPSKGPRSYRLLSQSFASFWPRGDRPTPAWEARVLGRLSEEHFGRAWDPARGLLSVSADEGRLREGFDALEPQRLSDPHLRYFAAVNPRYAEGEELPCLGRLDAGLLGRLVSHLGLRVARRLPWPRRSGLSLGR